MTDTYRPRNLDEVVGQRELKARLQVMVDGAMFTRALPHMLFTGPPGTGKTSIAEVLADLTGDDLHKLTMPVDVKELERLVRHEKGIFVLDELHKASALFQARLMVLMERGYLPTASGEDIWPQEFITIIGATTNAEKIDAALYDRFMVPVFEPYSPDDMAAIVTGMSAKAGITLAAETTVALGRAATGSPRCALRLMGAAEALTSARYGIEPDLESILHQAGFAADGLTELHLIYLESLLDFDGAGLTAFARYLRLHPTVVMDLERLLRRQHLVEFSGSGRRITQAGRRRITERMSERVAA